MSEEEKKDLRQGEEQREERGQEEEQAAKAEAVGGVALEGTAADPEREAKLKAAAEARAARQAAKAEAVGGVAPEGTAADSEREAKLKAAAEARAARQAAKAEAVGSVAPEGAAADPEREAKLKAAAEARAARQAAKEKADAEAAQAAPPEPSPKQPEVEAAAALLKQLVGSEAVEEAYINELNGHMPTLVIKKDAWLSTAKALKGHEAFGFHYLRNVSGVDYETHLETVYHLVSLTSRKELAVKVKVEREAPALDSVTSVWSTANWNEREIYDLLGITFTGHPDLRRIMMPDDWVGHPLRKDYEPLDSEV
ncbi:NADH-quinone oxidoreductase subunit C [Paenibacillus sp. NPDC058071]|uniref:NADH-quinone oxidoreductase subunit C n=1 Tax=Paenibacillus sp. NPDC058071 TaxID=3346326 RepID=UPI0036D9ABBD